MIYDTHIYWWTILFRTLLLVLTTRKMYMYVYIEIKKMFLDKNSIFFSEYKKSNFEVIIAVI